MTNGTTPPLHGKARSLAMLGLLTSAMIWGLSWWPLQQLQGMGVHPLWSTSLMFTLISALISLQRPASWRILLSEPSLWLIVLVSGTTNIFFNLGVTSGDVVRVVLLFYLMPVWTVPLAWLVLREPVRRPALLRLLIATAGAVVVLWPTQSAAWSLADLLGLLAGVGFALNTVLLRRAPHADPTARALAMFVGSAVLGAVLALALGVAPPSAWRLD